ncbi:uncharacterized protein PFLUO_LOCUS9512 [Penicillium psychrofluorescens]|uniref:uncharacterized protein n=1 Tax=Penicillium psychrofluorescens TaxID=3158075 RepID=UPI003CCE1CEF
MPNSAQSPTRRMVPMAVQKTPVSSVRSRKPAHTKIYQSPATRRGIFHDLVALRAGLEEIDQVVARAIYDQENFRQRIAMLEREAKEDTGDEDLSLSKALGIYMSLTELEKERLTAKTFDMDDDDDDASSTHTCEWTIQSSNSETNKPDSPFAATVNQLEHFSSRPASTFSSDEFRIRNLRQSSNSRDCGTWASKVEMLLKHHRVWDIITHKIRPLPEGHERFKEWEAMETQARIWLFNYLDEDAYHWLAVEAGMDKKELWEAWRMLQVLFAVVRRGGVRPLGPSQPVFEWVAAW